jgi:hypothetical protein
MEKNIEQNIMPRFELVSPSIIERFRRMARFLMPQETEMCLSTHIRRDNGLLDTTGDDGLIPQQPELPFGAPPKDIPPYDDMGSYLDRE